MGYVDPQDRARQREEALREAHNEELGQQRAALVDRDVRGRGLFMDERRTYLDQLVKTDLNNAHGHVAPADLQAAQEEAWAAFEPIIYEKPDRPLSVDAVKALVAGIQRGPLSVERGLQVIDFLTSTRTKVYETKASQTAGLTALSLEVAKARPKLNAFCKQTGAGGGVILTNELRAESADRASARQRTATAARPFAGLLPPKPAA